MHDDHAEEGLALALLLFAQGVFWGLIGFGAGYVLWGGQ